MTVTKLSRAATLHALADHIGRYESELTDDIIGICFSRGMRDILTVHVYLSDAIRSWISSLADVTASAVVHDGSIQLTVTGTWADLNVWAELPVAVLWICSAERDPAVHATLLALLDNPESVDDQTIELPGILTGGSR